MSTPYWPPATTRLPVSPPGSSSYGEPALIVFQNRLYLFVEYGGTIWYTTFDGASWSNFQQMHPENPSKITGKAGLAVFRDVLFIVHAGGAGSSSNRVWCTTFDGTTWSPDQLIPDADNPYGVDGSPALVSFYGFYEVPARELLYCLRAGSGGYGEVWGAIYNGGWQADKLMPDSSNPFGISASPALAAYKNNLYLFHQGKNDCGYIWVTSFNGTVWSADQPTDHGISGTPALAAFEDSLYCIRRGRDDGAVWCVIFNGGTDWSTDQLIPNAAEPYVTTHSPALVVFQGKLYLFGVYGDLWYVSYPPG